MIRILALLGVLVLAGCASGRNGGAEAATREAQAIAADEAVEARSTGAAERADDPVEGAPAEADAAAGPRELFPGVVVDLGAREIRLPGEVPIEADDPRKPVFLEVIACPSDTKEHEALVMVRARPRDVHAALLLLGIEAGAPGSVRVGQDGRVVRVGPTGPAVEVRVVIDGEEIDPLSLIVAETDRDRRPVVADDTAAFVFAGSRIREGRFGSPYVADDDGTIVGLATFGSEVVAFSDPFSPEAGVRAPEWIADPERIPAYGTPVEVVLRPAR